MELYLIILMYLGYVITSFAPIIWSLLFETRYTEKVNMILYGLASIGFALIYLSDPSISAELFFLKILSLAILVPFGLLSIFVGFKIEDGEENFLTLFLSGRQFGAFQLPFLYSKFFGLPPKIIGISIIPSVIELSLILLFVFNVISLGVFIWKNYLRDN